MKKISAMIVSVMLAAATTAQAGGLLTNTNQSIDFLRNPARDGAIGLDGVYSNPAGVAFLNDGLHLSVNWQAAMQKRKVDTTNPLFALGIDNNGATTKHFEGTANAPFIPSVQVAYNKNKLSLQFNFSVTGGGGKCEFENGLGSFEGAVAQIGKGLQPFGAQGYDAQYYMRGKQFYFGFQLGAAYKVTDNLSVYGGLRALYGTASYKAKISDIMVKTEQATIPFGTFLDGAKNTVAGGLAQANAAIEQLTPVKDVPDYAEKYKTAVATKAQLEGASAQLNALEVYKDGVNLQSDQTGFGIAPVIGVDYKVGNFNFAAKYDFRVKMSMKNESTLKEAMAIEAVNQFRDGTSVREDAPALLALGAQWNALPNFRINAGYHHFYDKESKKYGDKQDKLSGGTNEYLGGVEYDATKKLTVSTGFQITKYGLTDDFMSDLSFVVDSWSFGLGAKYQFTDKLALNVAYFQTNYGDYTTKMDKDGIQNTFTRTNRVLGLGCEVNF